MNLSCSLRLHSWYGCKCSKCGKVRDKHHSWKKDDCSVCEICGKVVEHNHLWEKDNCGLCKKCGIVDEYNHSWDGCICKKCEVKRDFGHHWVNDSCSKCGKKIETVRIGNQIWMKHSLDTIYFRNGDRIRTAIDLRNDIRYNDWNGACSYAHNKDSARLYSYFAVEDQRGLAPKGWRIPTKEDFQILLKNVNYDGAALIAVGETSFATNESGFSAKKEGEINGFDMAGGVNNGHSSFGFQYWGQKKCTLSFPWVEPYFQIVDWSVASNFNYSTGRSVRCIKD